MKGILKNTTAGWFVWYNVMRDEITSGYESLPLHPDNVKDLLDTYEVNPMEGREVEYEEVGIYNRNGQVGYRYVNYAKLIAAKEQTNGERFEEFMRTVEGYPELEGTTNLCEDIIEKKTGKMTEEEWQAAERAQTPRMYSEEEVLKILYKSHNAESTSIIANTLKKWFEQFKKK